MNYNTISRLNPTSHIKTQHRDKIYNGSYKYRCWYTTKRCKTTQQIQFKYINQLDATTSKVYYLTFMYSSTCFGRPHAHHQELNNCSSSLWFYRWSLVVALLLVVVGPAGRPDRNRHHCYHQSPTAN